MNTSDIFNQLMNHLLEGMMVHEQLANYFNFLALEGFKYCHDYHYLSETLSFRKIQKYYIDHYNRLTAAPQPNIIEVIPPSWYDITRQEVSVNMRKDSIQKGMLAWRNWEHETKKLYEQIYQDLISINEVASAEQVRELIIDVDEELAEVERMQLEILSTDTDLSYLIPEQKSLRKEYTKKINNMEYK